MPELAIAVQCTRIIVACSFIRRFVVSFAIGYMHAMYDKCDTYVPASLIRNQNSERPDAMGPSFSLVTAARVSPMCSKCGIAELSRKRS